MVEPRRGLDLTPEALPRAGEVELTGPDELEGDVPGEAQLVGTVDDAHPALADALLEAEVTQLTGGVLGRRIVDLIREQAGTHEPGETLADGGRFHGMLRQQLENGRVLVGRTVGGAGLATFLDEFEAAFDELNDLTG